MTNLLTPAMHAHRGISIGVTCECIGIEYTYQPSARENILIENRMLSYPMPVGLLASLLGSS